MDSPPSSEWDEEFFDASRPLRGVVVCCTNIPPDHRTAIASKVDELGGQHEHDLTPKTTHLIVGAYNTHKYRHVAKSRPDIRPMAAGWIDAIRDLWVADNPIDFPALERKWSLKTFESLAGGSLEKTGGTSQNVKLMCCISGMDREEREELVGRIQANGGNYSGNLDKSVTHLLIEEPTGKKYYAAKKWEIHVVHPQWAIDSIKRGMILDEDCYNPHMPREEIGRDAWSRRDTVHKSLGKRLREAAEEQNDSGKRKLRKTASMKLNSQRDNMWGEILAQQPSADQSGATLQAGDPTQPLPTDSILRNQSEQVSVKDSLSTANDGPDGIFASCRFHVTGFPQRHVDVLGEYITSRGGAMIPSLDKLETSEASSRCFVVVPQASDRSLHPPVSDGVEIVTDFFIEKCVYKKGTTLPSPAAHVIGRPFPVFPIESFDTLSICTSGFTELDLLHVSKVVRQLGARYEERFTAQCSILVCTSLEAVRKQKLEMAMAFGTPVVRAEWLWECISQGKKLPSQDFVFPQFKSRKPKALPNKSLNRSKSSSDMRDLTPKSLTGRSNSSTRTSLPGPDLSAFDEAPLSTDSQHPKSREQTVRKIFDTAFDEAPLTTDSQQPQSREQPAKKIFDTTPDFDTAPTHQSKASTGSQPLTSRPVSRGGSKALSEWSASDINQNPKNDQAAPLRKPMSRVRSEIADSEAGDDDGLFDFAGDEETAAAQDPVKVEDPVEVEKRRIQQEKEAKEAKEATERIALANKLTSLLEGTTGSSGDNNNNIESSTAGAVAEESSRAAPGPPPARRKRDIIGRVISNVSAASNGSEESTSSRTDGMARTYSAVRHEVDLLDVDEKAVTGPGATQIEYADPDAVKSKNMLKKKMLSKGSSGTRAGSSADSRVSRGGSSTAGGRSTRRR